MAAIAQVLESIVGATNVRAGSDLEPWLQQQIHQAAPESKGHWVAPATVDELAEVMRCTDREGWRVLPCGSGSKLHWGGLGATVDVVISTQRLNRLIDHAIGDLTVTAEAGMGFANLQATLGPAGQFLAIDPCYADRASLGGIIATGDTGCLRQRYNSVRDMLLGITFVRSDGEIVKAGGRVVKNVAGYDLMKLLTGAYGTLGIITQATLRVYPQPEAAETVLLQGEPEAIAQALLMLLNSALIPAAIELLSAQALANLGQRHQMGLVVRFQSIAISVKQQTTMLLELGQTLGLTALLYPEAATDQLWQQLAQPMSAPESPLIASKIGVKPASAVAWLSQLEALVPAAIVVIHGGSGLGWLVLPSDTQATVIAKIRDQCVAAGGYLSLLQGPIGLKQQVDVWGYAGNALDLMQKIKQQFDPANRLSPGRFVGGI
jgi:glycolate oxidase FAD binding subunit